LAVKAEPAAYVKSSTNRTEVGAVGVATSFWENAVTEKIAQAITVKIGNMPEERYFFIDVTLRN
jgi:hypothetical protein